MLKEKIFISASITVMFLMFDVSKANVLQSLKNIKNAMANTAIGQAVKQDALTLRSAALSGVNNVAGNIYTSTQNSALTAANSINSTYQQNLNSAVNNLQNMGGQAVQAISTNAATALNNLNQAKATYEAKKQAGATAAEIYAAACSYNNTAIVYNNYVNTQKQLAEQEHARLSQEYQAATQSVSNATAAAANSAAMVTAAGQAQLEAQNSLAINNPAVVN
ncbi:MAG: hypothetical protein IJ730_07080 [Alphaproteobacteria bacterium]|nr:hypothetical protein [Alphaproteobacteria bacterium]